MNKREIVQAFMDSIQQGKFEIAKSVLADDFVFSGLVPKSLNKDAWLKMSINLKSAFPDLDYHFKVIGTNGDTVRSSIQLSGTHKGLLNLIDVNLGTFPITDKAVTTKTAKTKVTIKDGKITLWDVEQIDGGDLAAIIKQLHIDV